MFRQRTGTGAVKVSVTETLTRPADTTAYAAKDTVGISLAVTGATNATPIVLTTGTHELSDGDPITVASVGGNTNANGNWFAKVTGYSSTTFGLYRDRALTLPVNGNASYTSGGTVARLLVFENIGRELNGSGFIVKAILLTDQTTNTETFKLHLYSIVPTALLDNAACTAPLYADVAGYVGTILFPAAATEGTGVTAAYSVATPNSATGNLPMQFILAGYDDLFGILETPTGFTPASGQKVTIKLSASD